MTEIETPTDQAELLGSVVIAAHNEADVIEECLDALFDGLDARRVEVVVVCNGCTDDTAAVVRSSGHPLRVIELPRPSKPAALRAGDEAVTALPRIYLDADVMLPGVSALAVLDRLHHGAVASRPPARYETGGSSWPVRRYYEIRASLPSSNGALWGAGVYGLSAAGRSRFEAFPDLTGDDLWVDRHFGPGEVEIVDCPPVVVVAPRTSRDLLAILRRAYRGKAEAPPAVAETHDITNTRIGVQQDLRRLLLGSVSTVFSVAVYAAFALAGRIVVGPASKRAATWERDESSRQSRRST